MKEVLTIKILAEINRTNNLKIALTSILKQLAYKKLTFFDGEYCFDGSIDFSGYDTDVKVYYRKAPPKTTYPYLVFNLKHSKDDHIYNYFWEVHVWNRDVKDAEEIADFIECLDDCTYKDEQQNFDIELESRNNIEDEDKELQHIVLLFNLSYFNVKG